MNHVIIVNGPPRAGKDTAIEFMSRAFKQRGYMIKEYSSIDPVRNNMQFFGIDVSKKTPEDRKLLATIGDALQEHSDYRTKMCEKEADEFFGFINSCKNPSNKGAMFIHIREPDLIFKLAEAMTGTIEYPINFFTIQVKGGCSDTVEHNNKSDAETGKMFYDITINNDGSLGELFDACENLVRSIHNG